MAERQEEDGSRGRIRVDALKLAELSSVNQLPQVKIPSKEVREWRSLIHHRQMLVARRTRIKNMMRDDQDWNPKPPAVA